MASERGLAQTQLRLGVVGLELWIVMVSGSGLERPTKEGNSPVRESQSNLSMFLSRAGHEKPCLNPGGPPSKAKYELMTDSAEVP